MENTEEIYMEYIRNICTIDINVYDKRLSETKNTDPIRRRPCSLFLNLFSINIYEYSLYIQHIFSQYLPYICPCVFLTLFRQQKTHPSPYVFHNLLSQQ